MYNNGINQMIFNHENYQKNNIISPSFFEDLKGTPYFKTIPKDKI